MISYIIVLILLCLIITYFIQDKLIYPGLLKKENINFSKKMDILNIDNHKSFLLKPENVTKKTKLWVFFTGTNMIAGSYYKTVKKIQKYNKNDIMLIFEYPGFGINHGSGSLSIHEINNFITKNIDHLKKEYNFSRINIFAWSLGCAIAIKYASENYIDHIYLLSPFETFQEAINNYLYGFPLERIIKHKNRWNNINLIKNIKTKKITVFHGTSDELVPFKCGVEVYRNIPKGIQKKFIKFEGAGHNIFNLIDYKDLD